MAALGSLFFLLRVLVILGRKLVYIFWAQSLTISGAANLENIFHFFCFLTDLRHVCLEVQTWISFAKNIYKYMNELDM